jgi:hypothetical protein
VFISCGVWYVLKQAYYLAVFEIQANLWDALGGKI